MRTLILIKHAMPQIDTGRPAHTWPLSQAGRTGALALGERLRAYQPAALVTSHEPKAAETGRITAEVLGLACAEADGLHEHDRTGVEWMGDRAFQAAAALFFRQPDDLVFGLETARQAEQRFAAAVGQVLARYPAGNLAIVTHGTVLTLFVARHNQVDRYAFWRSLGLPALVALTLPELRIAALETTIDAHGS
jgi:broad specificity phosphatase PhoE